MKKKKKRAVTLIEMMIVILLIGLIGGALAFNMRGSLDKGRSFTTEQNMLRIQDILTLEYADKQTSPAEIASKWKTVVLDSPLVKGEKIIKDGWGVEFKVSANKDENADNLFEITSKKNEAFLAKKHVPEKK
jgi:prepilin-type N-terminal cleavage/methylation domain-containing protein